VINA